MGQDDQGARALADELYRLRIEVENQNDVARELTEIRHALEDIKGNMNSGGGD